MTAAFLRRTYAGGGTSTTLNNSMSSTDTSFTVTSATGWPGAPGTSGFIVVVDRGTTSEEKILCLSNSGTTVAVASSGRGYDGTSATSHNSNATVSLVAGAIDFNEANEITNLLGNGTAGLLLQGGGTGSLPTWASLLTLTTTSGNLSPTNGQFVEVTGTATISLPTEASSTNALIGVLVPGSSEAVTISAANDILGQNYSATSINLYQANVPYLFWCDGSNWFLINGNTGIDSGWKAFSSYSNSWASNGGPYLTTTAGSRLIGSEVFLGGSIKSGSSGNSAFTLISGHRPSRTINLAATMQGGGTCLLSVTSGGVVTPTFSTGSIPSLDGVSFLVN